MGWGVGSDSIFRLRLIGTEHLVSSLSVALLSLLLSSMSSSLMSSSLQQPTHCGWVPRAAPCCTDTAVVESVGNRGLARDPRRADALYDWQNISGKPISVPDHCSAALDCGFRCARIAKLCSCGLLRCQRRLGAL